MSKNNSTLARSKNWFRAVGEVSENALIREDCKIKVRDEDGNPDGTRNGERIRGKVAIKTDTGIHTFDVFGQSLTSKGENNKMWAAYEAMTEWKQGELVALDGSVAINDYVTKNGTVSTSLRWNVRTGNTRVKDGEASGVTLEVVAYVQNIKPETRKKGDDVEETGRLCVTLLAVGNNGDCFPINAIVDKDMADGFEEYYEVGQTAPFTLELNSHHVGGKKTGAKAFGRAGKVEVNSGFDVSEIMLVGGDDVIEEPEELEDEDGNAIEDKSGWINPVAMKKAIKARAQMLEELEKNPPEKKSGGKASFADKKKGYESKAKAKPSVDEDDGFEDGEELPF